MKRIFHILITLMVLGSFFSCEPVENRDSLPEINKTASTLNFSVSIDANNKNKVILVNNDSDVIPYWSYTDALGNELGHYNANNVEVSIPFAGTYYVHYTGYTRGGAVEAEAKKVVISQNDLSLFSDPRWDKLANGTKGKTWVLNMVAPLEFIGGNRVDYVNRAVSGPGWWPNLSDISWAGLENKDWGEITFDLNGGNNVTVDQTNPLLGSTLKTKKTGTFNFALTNGEIDDKITFNGGTEMLHPNEPSYFSSSFSFTSVKIVELTENSLCFIAIRADNDYLIYHLIPKS